MNENIKYNSAKNKTTTETDDEKTTTSIMQHSIDSGQHTPNNDETSCHENVNRKNNKNSIPHKSNSKSELSQKSADSVGREIENSNRSAFDNEIHSMGDNSKTNIIENNLKKDSVDIEEHINNHISKTACLKDENDLNSQNAAQINL